MIHPQYNLSGGIGGEVVNEGAVLGDDCKDHDLATVGLKY